MNKKGTSLRLAASLGLCLGLWVFALVFDRPQVLPRYLTLQKPALVPPQAVLIIGWGIMFVLLGVALFILWQNKNKAGAGPVLTLFVTQLALIFVRNLSFVLNFDLSSGLAMGLVLLANGLVVAVLGWRIHHAVTWLLLPYLGWLVFFLTFSLRIFLLNR
ncbi:MAG: TspO/MBR family protein [Candidatus Andersenbacteria bacterium]